MLRRPPQRRRSLSPLVKDIEAAGGEIHARSLDARKEEEIISFLDDADKHAPLEVCIFNIGANVNFPILETTERVFRKVWEMACYSGFLAGPRSGAPDASARGGQHLLHRCDRLARGGSGYAAFASAKFGLRAVAQAIARELGPERIFTSRISSSILACDTEMGCGSAGWSARAQRAGRSRMLLMPPSLRRRTSYWQLYQQPRSAWTFELEIRPFGEKW